MQHSFLLSILTLSILSVGCRAPQMAHDGIAARQALLTLYTDQAMDNLIRARLNQPFIQLTYRDVLVQETDTLSANASTGQSSVNSRSLAGAAFTLGRNVTKQFSLGGSGQQQGQLSLKADPVTNQNDIYEAYLALARNPYFLHVTDRKPDFPVHICRERCGKYFWIPCEQGQVFLELVLKTSMMRGPDTLPPPAYVRTIVDIPRVEEGDEGATIAYLQFSDAVPNGEATMLVKMDGRKIRVKLRPYLEPKFGEKAAPNLGERTKYLIGQWVPKTIGFGPDDLLSKTVSILSDDYPPEAPTPLPQLEQLLDEVDRIRANQALDSSSAL